jgi:TonB family protein
VFVGAPAIGAGQQTLEDVKDLYARAAYEDALRALAKVTSTDPVTDVASYRAACLLALGRADEATKVVEDVVEMHPEYRPDPADMSPKVVDLFRAARRVKVPDAARALYAQARKAMDEQPPDVSIGKFEALIRLLDDPEFAGDVALADLKVLAGGFLELTRARAAARPEVPPPAPAEALDPPARQSPEVTAAVPVSQLLPAWSPPEGVDRWTFTGAVRIRIAADGTVASATIEKPVHAAYDASLLAAARRWVYRPALRDGVPVESEQVVPVILRPR